MPPVNNYPTFPPVYNGPTRIDPQTGALENYEPPPRGYVYGQPYPPNPVPRLIPTSTAPQPLSSRQGGSSDPGRAPGTVPQHPALVQYREEAASSSRGRTKPASNYPLPPEIQKAFGQLDRGQKPLIRHLSRFAEDHPDDAIRCSLEDIATLPSGEKRSDIWRHPAVSAWLESLENPYRPWSLGGNGHGASNLKAFRTLLGHEDIDYQDVDKNMSVATIRFLSDERVSSRTKKYASIICHAAHFVENHPDPAIRCTLKDIVDFPGENGVWGNPSVLAWLDSKDNPYRLESEGGDGSGPVAIRALRRDFGKKDQ